MKKFILSLALAFLMLANTSYAATYVKADLLKDASGTVIQDYSMTTSNVVYSQKLSVFDDLGVRAILVTEDQSGGAGDVDISLEYSVDGTNFYPAYTTSNGVIVVEDIIVEGLGNQTAYITFPARIAPFMRFKFDPDANSEVTIYFIYLRDR